MGGSVEEKGTVASPDPEVEDDGCVDGTWSRPVQPPKVVERKPLLANENINSVAAEDEKKKSDRERCGLIISMVTLLASIPALIGAWCWPALVIGLLSGAVTSAARSMGHYISLSITGTMMIALNAYMMYCAITKRKKLPFTQKFGPFMLTVVAGLLILADLLRHVLQDTNIWKAGPWPGSSEYRSGCEEENVTCLSAVGWIFTIACTYSGFILLFWGTMWNANLLGKLKQIKKQWQALRSNTK